MGRKAREKSHRAASDAPTVIETPQEEPASTAASPWRTALVSAALVLLVAIVFTQLRTHQFLNYDDQIYVTDNPHVRAGLTPAGVKWAFTSMDYNWHPVTWLTHMLDVQLFGVDAGAILLVNALFHAINCVLLLLLLVRATRRFWPAAFVAALFAIHPLHVESVAWISERKDVLSTLFFLLTLYLYVRFTESRSKGTYAALTLTFILGLMSKGMLVTLPFVLLLLDYWPLRRLDRFDGRTAGKLVLEKLPLFILIIPSAVMTYVAQRSATALVELHKAPLLPRMANAAISYVSYIGKMFWPVNLAIPYPYRVVVSRTDAILATLLLLVITVAALWMRRSRPWVVTGWFWFLGTLVPVIGLVQIGVQAMADRYTYIPMIGLFVIISWSAAEVMARLPRLQPLGWTAAIVIIGALTFAAHAQVRYWQDSESLFRHTIAVTDNNWDAHMGLGNALLSEKKDAAGAAHEFEAANAVYDGLAPSHQNLGAAYYSLGRYDDAAREYERAIAIEPTQQRYRELATIQLRRGRSRDAAQLLARTGDKDPATLAWMALERGNTAEALAKYAEAIRVQPADAALRNDYAAALAKAGRDDDAMKQYQEALRLDPSQYDARMNFGAVLSRHDRNDEAIAQFQAAAKLQPGSTEPHVYLALALAQSGRNSDAAREAEAAAAINEKAANDQFTAAVRAPASPNNLRQFIASMGGTAK